VVAAIGAGGVLRDITHPHHGALRLTELHRLPTPPKRARRSRSAKATRGRSTSTCSRPVHVGDVAATTEDAFNA
jgi:hypothetical protein